MKRDPSIGSGTAFMLCCLLTLCANAFAQTGKTTIRGTVVDQQNRTVPGATVALISAEKNITRTQTTTTAGGFVFTEVEPGTYRLEAQATGFKKETVSNVRALVDTPTDLTVQLEVGSVDETVSIQATGVESLVNTQDATIGNTFESRQIEQLPLEARNPVALLSLQPGVTPDGYVTGSRADQANITLDGVDVNEQQTGLDPTQVDAGLVVAFHSVLRVTPDSVGEFRVTTTNPNANQGRSSGAQVSLVTKSGTNEFHGSAYEFHRNTVTTANTFFNNQSGIPRQKLLRNVFGGSIGGPIRKNRLFFFYNYEGRRDASQKSVVETVPLPTLGQGIVRYKDQNGNVVSLAPADINNFFPAVGENPVALSILADAARRYPANDLTVGDQLNTGGFRFNAPTPLKLNTHIARFDYNLTRDGRHIVFFRGNYQSDHNSGAPSFPDRPGVGTWDHSYGFVAGHTWTVNSRLVNNFRYGLTRLAYSNQGNSAETEIFFRNVYLDFRNSSDQVNSFQRSFNRVTPVHNFTDDLSWVRGNHNFQFGTNIRIIRNRRLDFRNSFDLADTNYAAYIGSGSILTSAIDPDGNLIASEFITPVQAALAAVIGRLPEYSANFNFSRSGSALAPGTGVQRTFATEEYDFYYQDSWKIRPNLTLTYGLRYGLSRPVYETHGYETKPNISLSDYFTRRVEGAGRGVPYNALLTVDLAGPANNRPGLYPLDKTNFQPRFAIAYSPEFKGGWLHKIFGGAGDSVFRGGFAVTNDHFGQQLAVNFENNNTLGFTTTQAIPVNTFNVTDSPAPLLTGFGQPVITLPLINVPGNLTFPQQQPADMLRRIEVSLDDKLQTPVNYSWNVSFGRRLPAKFFVEASYIGRSAHHLLAQRDVMMPNDLVDPTSHMDWYTAAGTLEMLRVAHTPIGSIPDIPYFNNLFPNLGPQAAALLGNPDYAGFTPTQAAYGFVTTGDCTLHNDWTTAQSCIDLATGTPFFYNPQYGALAAYSTIGHSIYHAGTVTVRQRFKEKLTFDFNYTFSKSMDDASGLQTSANYGTALILNPIRQSDSFAVSDFDIRHIININGLWQIPVGRGRMFFSNLPKVANALLGGWQLAGIFRYNSGQVVGAPNDGSGWATNFELTSNSVRIRPIDVSPTRGGNGQSPNLFSDPVFAYQSFRNARPGESGDRNTLRYPSYIVLDMGLDKTFKMPWSERQQLQFRWEVFNVTNTQRLGSVTSLLTGVDPELPGRKPAPAFGKFTDIQGTPRIMQFGLRYTF